MGVIILGANTLYINNCLFKQIPMTSKGLSVGTWTAEVIQSCCCNSKVLEACNTRALIQYLGKMVLVFTSGVSGARGPLLRPGDGRSLASLCKPHHGLHLLSMTARTPHSLWSEPPLTLTPAFPSYRVEGEWNIDGHIGRACCSNYCQIIRHGWLIGGKERGVKGQ